LKEGINTQQLFIGLSFLVLGVLFYYYSRSAEHPYFLNFFEVNPQLKFTLPSLFVSVGHSLPTFIHALAFSLMTASFIAKCKKGYVIVCLSWFAVDALFEISQGLDNIMIQFVPDWFSGFLFLENTRNYFLHGRFDYFDLLSIALGSLTAYILLMLTNKEEGERR
jgi:hypothetical protein